MRRREALAAGGGLLAGTWAGCLEGLRREDAWRELVVDPPDGVYVPPHADGMVTYGTATADGREVSLLASRPHSFWVVADAERSRADIRSHHDLHLMATVRDAETGAFVPAPVRTTVRARGAGPDEPVDERSLWPMLSQRMGPHYGDNVSLAGDGAYAATIRIGATTAAATGDRDDLERATSVDVAFEYDADEIEGLERRLIDEDEGRGEPDALEPMDHAASGSAGPRLESTAVVGTATGDDIDYTVAFVDDERTGRSGGDRTGRDGSDDATLAVLTRTPYNAYPLPFAALSAAVDRGDEVIASASLGAAIDDRLGHCYLTVVDRSVLADGDELRLDLETPPQVARHEGYETAFLEAERVTMALDER